MDVLKFITRRLPVVIVLAITACLVVDGWTSGGDPGFPHDIHVVDEGLDCIERIAGGGRVASWKERGRSTR